MSKKKKVISKNIGTLKDVANDDQPIYTNKRTIEMIIIQQSSGDAISHNQAHYFIELRLERYEKC